MDIAPIFVEHSTSNYSALAMDRISFDYSTKNIPSASKQFYLKCLIQKTEKLIKNMRWRAFFYLNKPTKRNKKETFGFKSTRTPPVIEEMKVFESKMTQMIQNIEFTSYMNDFQKKLMKDVKKTTNTTDLIIKADKTTNFYRMKTTEYQTFTNTNVQKNYKKSSNRQLNSINQEAKKIASELELDDRIETLAEWESFITLKDHKPNFHNSPTCRLINPMKSDLGKASKQILERIVSKTVSMSKVNLWRNTAAVLDWFNNIDDKQSSSFICFDIVDFYPSITEKLLREALDFAATFQPISALDKEIIFHSKKTLLINNGIPWSKKDDNNRMFDVTMGSYDGAEACELVVCYLLTQLNKDLSQKITLGLYRDDGLAAAKGTPSEIASIKQKICEIFKKNG